MSSMVTISVLVKTVPAFPLQHTTMETQAEFVHLTI